MKEGSWERLGSPWHWSPRQEGGLLTAVFGGEGRPLSQDNAAPCSWNLPVFLDTQRGFFLPWWAKAVSNSVLTGRREVQVRKPSWGGWGGFPSLAHGLLALAPGMVHQKWGRGGPGYQHFSEFPQKTSPHTTHRASVDEIWAQSPAGPLLSCRFAHVCVCVHAQISVCVSVHMNLHVCARLCVCGNVQRCMCAYQCLGLCILASSQTPPAYF